MTKCLFMGATGVGIWEKPATGDKMAPFNHPENDLDLVYFHSLMDYYNSASGAAASVPITHGALSASAGVDVYGDGTVTTFDVPVETDYVLLTHGLGYECAFMVTVDGVQLPGGLPIQTNSAMGERIISAYSTATQIILHEQAIPRSAALPSLAKTYLVTAFRAPGDVPGSPIVDIQKTNADRVRLAHDRIDTYCPSLRQAIVGESAQFYIAGGPTIDADNGQVKVVTPDGTAFQTGPSGGSMAYTGAFAGSGSVKAVMV